MQRMSEQGALLKSDQLRKHLRRAALAGAIFWVGTIGFYLFSFHNGMSSNQDVWGQFGDFLGGTLNPIFAFMTFIAILYTLALQADQVRQSEKTLQVTEEQVSSQARDSNKQLTASVLLELRQIYSTDDMNHAVHYLTQLQRQHLSDFNTNRYLFARQYIASIEPTSPEWGMRRRVSHFYSDAAALVETGCVNVEDFFASYGSSCEIIEFLEPIEVAIAERIYGGPHKQEWVALRLLARCRAWKNEQERKGADPRFTAPTDPGLYAQSLDHTPPTAP